MKCGSLAASVDTLSEPFSVSCGHGEPVGLRGGDCRLRRELTLNLRAVSADDSRTTNFRSHGFARIPNHGTPRGCDGDHGNRHWISIWRDVDTRRRRDECDRRQVPTAKSCSCRLHGHHGDNSGSCHWNSGCCRDQSRRAERPTGRRMRASRSFAANSASSRSGAIFGSSVPDGNCVMSASAADTGSELRDTGFFPMLRCAMCYSKDSSTTTPSSPHCCPVTVGQ